MSSPAEPAAASVPVLAGAPGGFSPPPYPYDRLAALSELAAAAEGGMVDLSVGTPGDPPPRAVVAALASSGTEAGYPASVGSLALRRAAAGWVQRRFAVTVDPAHIAACVGTKEFVASAAWYLRLRDPSRDTVLHPAVAYPTYALGAQLAGCRAVGVPERPDGGLDVDAIDPADAARAVVLWVNSPANPTGTVTDLSAVAAWGRRWQVPVISDECYAEFTWATWPPPTILHHGRRGLLALHSLSKRSNLAGVRSGFYAGDPDLVHYLSEIRKHAGLMVPGPVQAASAVAYDDDAHVEVQRDRYRRRLRVLADALAAVGLPCALPDGGFYLWVAAPPWAHQRGAAEGRSASWVLTEALARAGGILASPGDFYGPAGEGHVRLAVVQPDDRLQLAATRLGRAGPLQPR